MSNIGYDRKPGETTKDRMAQLFERLRPATKEEYERWLLGWLEENSMDDTVLIDEPFPVGNEETGGFFIAEAPIYVQFDCNVVKLYIIVPPEHGPTLRRDECSVIMSEKRDGSSRYGITEGELPPIFNDLNI